MKQRHIYRRAFWILFESVLCYLFFWCCIKTPWFLVESDRAKLFGNHEASISLRNLTVDFVYSPKSKSPSSHISVIFSLAADVDGLQRGHSSAVKKTSEWETYVSLFAPVTWLWIAAWEAFSCFCPQAVRRPMADGLRGWWLRQTSISHGGHFVSRMCVCVRVRVCSSIGCLLSCDAVVLLAIRHLGFLEYGGINFPRK